MSRVEYSGFDWDDGNRNKCQKHGLSIVEIEQFFASDTIFVAPDVKHSQTERRFLAIGQSSTGRGILVAYTLRLKGDDTFIRPISARYMHQKEWDNYEQAFTGNQ